MGRKNSGIPKSTGAFFPIAPGGFEPPFSDPKSDVLPLDEGAADCHAEPPNLVYWLNWLNARRGACRSQFDALWRGWDLAVLEQASRQHGEHGGP